MSFCHEREIDVFDPNVNNVLAFLTKLYNDGLSYSALNTARCALSSFLQLNNTVNIGSHNLVRRFFKGVFTLRPALPKYNVTWNVDVVLTYLKGQEPLESLSLLQLSRKLLMLLALLSGQRGQTLHLIDIRNVHITDNSLKVVIGDLLKTSKPGYHLGELNFSSFPHDNSLCVVRVITHFLERTSKLRNGVSNLFISTQKPHRGVSRDTISRWMKSVLCEAGIDICIFKPHSVRSASSSAAHARNIPIATILRTVGWSKDCVFRKFYNKPIVMDESFSKELLSHYKNML